MAVVKEEPRSPVAANDENDKMADPIGKKDVKAEDEGGVEDNRVSL